MAGTTIVLDTTSNLLRRLGAEATSEGLVLVGGRAAGNLIKEHLVQLNTERHKYGRGYYAQAAKSLTVTAVPQGAAISITQTGFRQRLFGGPIDPKNAKMLTIPASPEAYGHRASEFPDLQLTKAMNEDGRLCWALVRRLSSPISIRQRKKADGSLKTSISHGAVQGGEVMFWLVGHVNQDADPTVLPEDEIIQSTALAAMQRRMLRNMNQGAGGDS